MNHFEIANWADFARNLTPARDRAAMEHHLESGCDRCRRALDMVRGLIAAAQATEFEPPADIVRCVKALSSLRQAPRSAPVPLVARMVFNSVTDALPAGMRSEAQVARQVLYEAGPFCVDVRVEREIGAPQVTLVGQVSERKEPSRGIARSPVVVMAGQDVVAHAMSNRFGEFHMEYPPARSLRLRVSVDLDGQWIELPLNDLETARASSPRHSQTRTANRGKKGSRK